MPRETAMGDTWDVSDVALLFPVPTSDSEFALTQDLDRNHYLPLDAFEGLLQLAGIEDDNDFRFRNARDWKIVGVRFDPCRQDEPGLSHCQPQLRLVSQPVVKLTRSWRGRDHAMHLIYNLTAEQAQSVARGLWELKTQSQIRTNGKPLAFHPVMVHEGLGGPFAQGLRRLIAKFARHANLVEATAMVTSQVRNWRFVRMVRVGDSLVAAKIPQTDSLRQSLMTTKGHGPHFASRIEPPGAGSDSAHLLVNNDPQEGGFHLLPEANQISAINGALRIENPLRHSPATVDCVSCHVASRALSRSRGVAFLDAADGHPDRFASPPGVTGTQITAPDEISHPYAVRMFGYGFMSAGKDASVSQRTVNEAAISADFLNRIN